MGDDSSSSPGWRGADVINRVRAGEFAGLAVTMPLKEEAARSVDDLDAASTRQRSVNTVVGIGSGHVGLSTDGAGFVNSLYAQDIALTGAAHLLGAGGAARSIVARSVQLTGVRSRFRIERIQRQKRQPNFQAVLRQLLPTTFPMPLRQQHHREHHIGWHGLRCRCGAHSVAGRTHRLDHVVADIVYHPLTTALLSSAAIRGAQTVDGLGMLVHQAVLQCEAWTGFTPDPVVMRSAAEAELGQRSG